MKPLKLMLEGFGSYLERHELSFDGLTLFAISGPTGAGKSLLLDAITYALYGQTERLGGRNLDTLISPGADRLVVMLEFEGAAGRIYRVLRTADRKGEARVVRNTVVERLDDDAAWKRMAESERLRDADRLLEQLAGLDYEAFTRAVLLPQGRFDQFLHGDASKRRELLRSLLGLERLERMQLMAAERARQARADADAITGLLDSGNLEVEPGVIPALQRSLAECERNLEEAVASRPGLEQRLSRLEASTAAYAELATVSARLKELDDAAAEADGRERTISRARAAEGLAARLDRAARLRELAGRHAEQLAALKAGVEQLALRHAAAAAAAAEASGELEGKGADLRQRLERLRAAEPLVERLLQLGGDPAASVADAQDARWSEAALEANSASRSRLAEYERSLARRAAAARRLEQARAALAAAAERLDASETRLQDTIRDGQAAARHRDDLQAQHPHAHLAVQAAAIRAELAPGDACPVCGGSWSGHEPGQTSDEARAAIEDARRRYRELIERHAELKAEVAAASTRLEAAGEARAAAEASLEAADAEATAMAEGLGGGTPATIRQRLDSERASLIGALAGLLHESGVGTDPAASAREAARALERLQAAATGTAAALARIGAELEGARARLAARNEAAQETTGELTEAEQQLGDSLRAAGFEDEQAALDARLDAGTLHKLEQVAERLRTEHQGLKDRAAALASAAGDHDPTAELEEARAEAAGLAALEGELRERAGGLRAELAGLRKRQEQATELRARREELERRYSTWQVVNRDLYSQNFMDFLLSDVQRQLARRAGGMVRQVTEGRLDLHLAVDGSFEVSDAALGGERRQARSLSGGETFVVSLALALALSDTIAGNQALQALFLDEGFGTLDASTLDQVTEVLAGLVQDGRMVGIITHVTELSERLPARLNVRRTDRGSTLRWDD